MAAPALEFMSQFPSPGLFLSSKYRLVRELGSGGMGTVWLARNEPLGKDVAVKLLRTGIDAPDAAERFVREARAAASVDHPAIVRVFDYGTTDTGQPFIVMERLEGESFADFLERRETVPASEAIRIMLPVIDGLALAHAQGVIHRDLKPANFFLAREAGHAQPKVLDFGVAKLLEQDADLQLTRQGTVVGSPAYMAPEQAQGRGDVDSRCDIWAVCVVLYEAVTGKTPFDGDNYNAILASILVDEVPRFVEHPGEEGLSEIFARGLHKDRERRFQTMRELGEALATFLVRHGVHDDIRGVPLAATWLSSGSLAYGSSSVRPQPSVPADAFPSHVIPRRPRRWPWLFLGAAAITISVVAGHQLSLQGGEPLGADPLQYPRTGTNAPTPRLEPSLPAPESGRTTRAAASPAAPQRPPAAPASLQAPPKPAQRARPPAPRAPAIQEPTEYPVPRPPEEPPEAITAPEVAPPPPETAAPAPPPPPAPEPPARPAPSPSLDLKDPY